METNRIEMASNIEVIVGTYEQFLLGYKVEQDGDEHSLHQSFAVHAHIASVRSVHSSKRYLASGGADDRVYVYDMKTRQEIQMLTTHDSVVNHIRFTPDATHLLSAGADGKLAATRAGSWVAEGLWKAPHNAKPVTHITIHPSGKLALTLGADLTLKTWNLIKGRQIFTTNLKAKSTLGAGIDLVEFNPSGEYFVLTGLKAVELWSIADAAVVRKIECGAKPTCVCWLNSTNFLIGLGNGQLIWVDLHLDENEEPLKFAMYESRVKGLYYQNDHLASISSEGDVTVWTVNIDEQDVTELCSANIGCRPTCLTMINLADFAEAYVLKREADEEEEDEVVDAPKGGNAKRAKLASKNAGKVIIEVEDDPVATVRPVRSNATKPKVEELKKTVKSTPNKTPKKSDKLVEAPVSIKKTPKKASEPTQELVSAKKTPKKTSEPAQEPVSAKKTPKKAAQPIQEPVSAKKTPKKSVEVVKSPVSAKKTPKKSVEVVKSPVSAKKTPKKVSEVTDVPVSAKKTPKKTVEVVQTHVSAKKTPKRVSEEVEVPTSSKKRKSLGATPISIKKTKLNKRLSKNGSGFIEETN